MAKSAGAQERRVNFFRRERVLGTGDGGCEGKAAGRLGRERGEADPWSRPPPCNGFRTRGMQTEARGRIH
jgi:hypothetical protein